MGTSEQRSIHIAVRQLAQEIEVAIADTGEGMSLAMVRNFEPYKSTKPGGMGLDWTVPGHRPGARRPYLGKIATSSRNYLYFHPTNSTIIITIMSTTSKMSTASKPTVYLIDDDKSIRESIRLLLKSTGILNSFRARPRNSSMPCRKTRSVASCAELLPNMGYGTDAGAGKA